LHLPDLETDYTFRVDGGPSGTHSIPSGTFINMELPITTWDPESATLCWESVEEAEAYYLWFWTYDENTCTSFWDIPARQFVSVGDLTCYEITFDPDQTLYSVQVQALDLDSELGIINQSDYFTIVSEGIVPCIDNDNDGYGTVVSPECESSMLDCNDCNEHVYPSNSNPYCDCVHPDPIPQGTAEVCDDGFDNDCDGLVDNADPECRWGAASVQASVYGQETVENSSVFNNLAFLLVPVGGVVFLRILRRKR
jgi:hypothetical protein